MQGIWKFQVVFLAYITITITVSAVSKMNYNTQNAKFTALTKKTLRVGINIGGQMNYARALASIV